MDSIKFQPCLKILLWILVTTTFVAKGTEFPTPFSENVCDVVECGRGSCEAAAGLPFNYRCNCDGGWRRTRGDDEQNLQFLPCIIPNCSVDYSCLGTAAPPPSPPIPYNTSFFDPCYWIYCGEGTCTKNATYTHTCQCRPGYSNLNNISAFPCYNDCAVGSLSCQRLGIRLFNSTSNPSRPQDQNQATTVFSMGKFNWLLILLISATMIFYE